ncbi:ABC transporter ATP-binding protein [Halolamina litorea]|uniref:Nickel import system ATP-binding protein NikD n=1 Tax=Halolamina litorea TaxID=1515593 RepID=A0ABD6BUZ5_9EURY|nr:ABC transporter ATP-binding protein [Halolamina litorea]
MSETPLLSVRDLQTQFFTEEGTVRAVDGISFDVNEREIVGLVGESGAGKSVAAASLLQLVEDPGRIVNGTVEYKGETILDVQQEDGEIVAGEGSLSPEQMRKRIRGNEIAIIFQDPMESLNPVFTIGGQLREVIEINRGLSAKEARKEAVDMLREVGIPEPEERFEDYPHQFSGGMRQRVLIAMALACEPSLIIADEPTTALDVTVEGQILELVEELQDRYDTSFVWVTHDMGVVAEICDRVNVMYLGEVVEQSTVDDLFYDTKHPYTRALLESIPRPDVTVDELNPITGVMPEAIDPPSGCRFHTRCPDAREACREVAPTFKDVSEADEARHATACLQYESVGYEDSTPLETEATAGFGAGLTAGFGDDATAGGEDDE